MKNTTTSSAHTAGPWTVHVYGDGSIIQIGAYAADHIMHNARLIASAPEILKKNVAREKKSSDEGRV